MKTFTQVTDTSTLELDTSPVQTFKPETDTKCPDQPKLCTTCRTSPVWNRKKDCFTCHTYNKCIKQSPYNV